jgi:hypothetical protein
VFVGTCIKQSPKAAKIITIKKLIIMKKILFLFAMLVSVAANATVTVIPLGVDYATQKVTFKVEWTGTAANNRVWVWIDLCPVAGTTAGTFEKAVISNPTAITGSIITVSGNNRGFYVTTNPSTVTATLSNASGKFNWCVYGSDYPPNATSYNNGTYTLKGTQPFIIIGNGTIQNGNKYVGTKITSLTDATGYPGGVGRDEVHNGGICAPGLTTIGSYCRDLTADAATYTTCSSIQIEIKKNTAGTTAWSLDALCPNGWRWPTYNELKCGWSNNVIPKVGWIWSAQQSTSDCYCGGAFHDAQAAAMWTYDTFDCPGCGCSNCMPYTPGIVYSIGKYQNMGALCVRN